MMSIIPRVGIHHHEPFLFCFVFRYSSLRICLLYIIPHPRGESQWSCVQKALLRVSNGT